MPTTPTKFLPAAHPISGAGGIVTQPWLLYLQSLTDQAAHGGGTGTVTSVTGTAPIVSTGGATPVISLADTAVTPGSYGSATQVGTFTVDAKGRITAAANVTITGGPILTSTVTLNNAQIKALPTAMSVQLIPAPGAGFVLVPLLISAYAKIVVAYTGIDPDTYMHPHTTDWAFDEFSYLVNGNGTGLTQVDDFLAVAGTNRWKPLPNALGSGAFGTSFTTDWGLQNLITDVSSADNQSFLVQFDNNGAGDLGGGDAGNSLTFITRYVVEALP